jgi:hypothetical protein
MDLLEIAREIIVEKRIWVICLTLDRSKVRNGQSTRRYDLFDMAMVQWTPTSICVPLKKKSDHSS